ncbi:acetyl-CoA carboxylase [soil metagenome]
MAEKTVKAPMPGTFYRRPDPESETYVEEGSSVSAGDTIGLIEVMKSFHEIKAEEDGTVAKVLVEDEEAVSAGQDVIELE